MIFKNEDNYKNKHGIYAIINKENGMAYIGQTRQKFVKRYWHHQWKLKDNSHDNAHLQNAWNKYGKDAFVFCVVDVLNENSHEKLNELEERYVGCCKRFEYNYNILDGGGGRVGVSLTEEHKRKIGEANRINMTGKKHSEETKRKMSEIRKGKLVRRHNDTITMEQAREIKQSLVSGEKPSHISKRMSVPYKTVNGIMSNNAWSTVYVDGWDEYRNNRPTYHRLTEADHKEIYRLHIEEGYTKEELSKMYSRTDKMIAKIFKKYEQQ